MARKRSRMGRPRKDGTRYKSGDLKPHNDEGTDQLRQRKLLITSHAGRELTPLGILPGRRLITEGQYKTASQFRALHLAVFKDAPRSSLPMMAKLPSGAGPWDADDAAARQSSRIETWEEKRDRWTKIRQRLTDDQWTLIQALVIHETLSRLDTRVFTDIIVLNVIGADYFDSNGHRAPLSVTTHLQTIGSAIDALLPPARRNWTEISQAQLNALSEQRSH